MWYWALGWFHFTWLVFIGVVGFYMLTVTSTEPRVLGMTERLVMYVNWEEIRKNTYIVFIGFSLVCLGTICSWNTILLLHHFYLPPLPVPDMYRRHIRLARTSVSCSYLPVLLSVVFIHSTSFFTSFIMSSVFVSFSVLFLLFLILVEWPHKVLTHLGRNTCSDTTLKVPFPFWRKHLNVHVYWDLPVPTRSPMGNLLSEKTEKVNFQTTGDRQGSSSKSFEPRW